MDEILLQSCTDAEGSVVQHGDRYHPNTADYCYNCLCHNGTEQMCLSAACGRPPNCDRFERVEKTCCSFICTNETTNGPTSTDALSTAGIRLAVSTATCVLIVVIILLLMHKLRRHRLLLSIRQGLGGQSSRGDTAVVYTTEYDGVDIDISYEPLHIPGAPPPYSPTCEDLELPPAYSAINESSDTATGQNGIINSGCQATPPESLYNISAEARAKLFEDLGPVKRTCGVGASNTDLTVDLSDSCGELRDDCEQQLSSVSSLSPQIPTDTRTIHSPHLPTSTYSTHLPSPTRLPTNTPVTRSRNSSESSRDTQQKLPVRLEPVGGELPPTLPTTSAAATPPPPASSRGVQLRRTISRSADSSPTAQRTSKVTLTQYGFIDDGSISDLLETNGTVIGLGEEELMGIAANKPDRLNARIRRQNRAKRNSKQLPATPDMQ